MSDYLALQEQSQIIPQNPEGKYEKVKYKSNDVDFHNCQLTKRLDDLVHGSINSRGQLG